VHKYAFGGGLLAFLVSLLVSGSAHAASLVVGGALLGLSGVLGLQLGRNIVIDVLYDAVQPRRAAPSDRAASRADSPLHRETPASPTPQPEDRWHANLVNAIYLMVGLWWLVMAVTWWLD
jgi:hypothetical protein